MLRKRVQLGLIHTAVAMTLVPINSTLNRVMIYEFGLSRTLVTLLVIAPYLLAPIQVWIGSFSDRCSLFGYRRTPFILLGLLLCVIGVAVSPQVAILTQWNLTFGLLAALLAFGAWGMGYNFSAVSYLSLVSELFGEQGRSRTVAVMFTMMILGMIGTGIALSSLMPTYSPEALERGFRFIAGLALALGLLGLCGLEPRSDRSLALPADARRYSVRAVIMAVTVNPVARVFFVYLLLLLAALLGQDVLLEPFGAQAFGMEPKQTSRFVSIMGAFTLLAFAVAAVLEGRVRKRTIAQSGNLTALAGFLTILLSGIVGQSGVFYPGLALLGFGTGLSTVGNLSLMFDMTVPAQVGLYIGAWGFSSALSRLTGLFLAGVVADLGTQWTGSALAGYLIVFGIETAMLLIAALLFTRIDVGAFRQRADEISLAERVAMVVD